MDTLILLEWMYAIAFVLSMFFNLSLLFIIKKYSNQQMRSFRNILIQTTVVDMINSILITFTHLRIEATEGHIYITTGNSWLNLGGVFQCSYLIISASICNVSFWSLPIQAIFRYISVARNSNLSHFFPTILYMTTLTMALAIGFPYYLQLTPIKGTLMQDALDEMPFWKNQNTDKFCSTEILSFGVLLFCFYLCVSQSFGFLIMIWSTWKLNSTLKNASSHLTAKTITLHTQMTIKMFAQAILPGFIAVLVTVIIIVAILIPTYDGGLFLILFIPYPWINVINPLLTLFCIHRYRNAVVAILLNRKSVTSNYSITKLNLSKSKHVGQQSIGVKKPNLT